MIIDDLAPEGPSLPPTPPNLGKRLRKLRQATGKSQAEVAKEVGVSRSTIAQMELGNRRLLAQEISLLAKIYDCSPTSLLVIPQQKDLEDDDLLNDLKQTIPEFAEHPSTFKGLHEAITLSRELTMLEETLGLQAYAAGPPSHGFGLPNSRWEGAHQGYVAAQEERWRMNLGDAPIREVDDTLAMMRVRATRAYLPRGMSSLYLQAPDTGTLVVVNESLSVEELRFQYVHGYAHALFDNDHRWIVCRDDLGNSLLELRATAFAGRFLLPETGIRRYLQSLGKDTLRRESWTVQKVFSEGGPSSSAAPVRVEGRRRKGNMSISVCDLTQIAGFFGVTVALSSHVLRNLRYMTDDELDAFKSEKAKGMFEHTKTVLHLRTPKKAPKRDAFRSRLLALAVEAFRRGAIDARQFRQSSALVGVTSEEQQLLLDTVDS